MIPGLERVQQKGDNRMLYPESSKVSALKRRVEAFVDVHDHQHGLKM